MRMTQCTEYKNHFYDADKFSSCPHCARLGFAPSTEKKGLFSRHRTSQPAVDETVAATSEDLSDEATVMLTSVLHPEELEQDEPKSVSQQVSSVSVSGSAEDIKTVAMYGFEEDDEPVVGWLVAINGEDKGSSFSLKAGKNKIGRNGSGSEVDVALDTDHSVSRGTQAVLIFEPKHKQFLLQTAGGASLVYLNDELLMTYASLKAYDRITVGETVLVFVPFCGPDFSWEEN